MYGGNTTDDSPAYSLQSRPAHLSDVPVDEAEAKRMQEGVGAVYKFIGNPKHDNATNAPVYWHPSFTLIKTLNVAPKEQKADKPPRLTGLYFTNLVYSKDEIYRPHGIEPTEFHYFLCFPESGFSKAKLKTSMSPTFEYPGDLKGCLWINTMNNHDRDFRHGSLLIQLAVEYSMHMGFEGRVGLTSNGNSDEFYIKMGFVKHEYNVWVLSSDAIAIWKEKIAKNPVLSKKELELIAQNKAAAKASLSAENRNERQAELFAESKIIEVQADGGDGIVAKQAAAFRKIYQTLREGQSNLIFYKTNFLADKSKLSDGALLTSVKSYVAKYPSSRTAKAWELAKIHYGENCSSSNTQLFKEIYRQAFQASHFFSLSCVMGLTFFLRNSVNAALNKNLLSASKIDEAKPNTRTFNMAKVLGG